MCACVTVYLTTLSEFLYRSVLTNDPPPEIKPFVTGTPMKVTTPFPEGKMVRACV